MWWGKNSDLAPQKQTLFNWNHQPPHLCLALSPTTIIKSHLCLAQLEELFDLINDQYLDQCALDTFYSWTHISQHLLTLWQLSLVSAPNLHLLNDNYQTCICWMSIQQGSLTSTTSDIFPFESPRSIHCTCWLSFIPLAIATESQVLPNPKPSSWADCSGINCCPASTHFHPSLLLLSEVSVKSRNLFSACMFLLIIK